MSAGSVPAWMPTDDAGSCVYRNIIGGPGLAEQDKIVRLVSVVQSFLHFHRDAAGQKAGLAPAANTGAAFEVES